MDEIGKINENNDNEQVLDSLKTYLNGICPTLLGISQQLFSNAINDAEKTDILIKFSQSIDLNMIIIGVSLNDGKT